MVGPRPRVLLTPPLLRGESPARQTNCRAVLTFVLDFFFENGKDFDYALCIYTLICLYIHISDDHDGWDMFAIGQLLEPGRVAPLNFSAVPHYFLSTLCPYFPESESSSAKEFDSYANAPDSYSDVPSSNVDGTLTLWWFFLWFLLRIWLKTSRCVNVQY